MSESEALTRYTFICVECGDRAEVTIDDLLEVGTPMCCCDGGDGHERVRLATAAEYAAGQETRCPVCNSEELDIDRVGGCADDASNELTSVVICRSCDASWTERWRLSGYVNLELPADVRDKDEEEPG